MTTNDTAALREWPWLAPLGALVSAAKDRDSSSRDQSYEVNVAHNTLFDILREREDRLAALEEYKADTEQLRAILGDSPGAKLVIELDALRKRIAALEAGMRGLVESSQTVTAGCCEFEHGEYCTEVWSADSVDTENNKYVLIPADELSALLNRPADGGK